MSAQPRRAPAPDARPEPAVLRASGLTKSFGKRQVLRSVSIEVRGGEVVGLLGPNGAGKTTTFYCVVGLTRPDSGAVLLGDHDLTQLPMFRRARLGISYLPQEPSVFRGLTVEDNINAILETLPITREVRRARLAALLDELSIAHLARSNASALSGGERRRLEITRALVIAPSFILLDEPFAGIDPIAVIDIQSIIVQLKERGIGVLLTDHNVRETLGICDRAYILNDGTILEEGTPETIAASPRAREIYLGERFRL
jgi:lipopolysaccharide export system ATP-binding protein